MKKFFGEFKTFITRGNVLDMAVGVIVGSSFTAIVNGLTNNVLKPLINWLLALVFGANSLSEIYTFLKPVYVMDANGNPTLEIDLANSIYIDWGAFINAIINFLIVAFVLFSIVKFMNHLRETEKQIKANIKLKIAKEDRIALKAQGIKLHDREAVLAYFKAKEEKAAAEKAKADAEAAEKAKKEREANPTAEDLLKKILAVLEKKD